MKLKQRVILWLYKHLRGLYRAHLNVMYTQEQKRVSTTEFTVTSHALLRYFERIEGYDLEGIAKKLTNGLAERVGVDGDGKYVIGNARVTVLKNTVVTVDEKSRDLPFKNRVIANPIRGLEKLK
jgi:hypothetical protein